MNEAITKELLEKYRNAFDNDRANRIAQKAAVAQGPAAIVKDYLRDREDLNEFSVSLKQTGVTNQKASGRCWMFAAMNFLRYHMVQKWNLGEFELSQSYPLFYDKLEKSNWFLENILDTLEEPVHSRVLDHLLRDPVGDGGQWDMFASLIRKYGLVPKSAMPESYTSSNTRAMNRYITLKLREDALHLRNAHKNGAERGKLREMKEEMLEEIHRILAVSLGNPPTSFTFEYRDKEGKFHRDTDLTPKSFYEKYIGIDPHEYISIINAPTKDKPFYRSYTVQYLGNVKEDGGVKYLNLPMDEFRELAVRQLEDGSPVWFGCDVGQFSGREGIMDLSAYRYDELFGITFGMNKAERLDYDDSLMTHAMVLQGVNLDETGKPNRWRVENSWGKDSGKDGYYVMTDDWFEQFTYQVVIHKKYLSEEQLAEYEKDPAVLDPWDPMGSLAD